MFSYLCCVSVMVWLRHYFCAAMFYVYSAGQTPRKVRHLCPGDQMDVYCSQCCKKVNLLNDLDARLKNLKSNRYKPYTLACMCVHT